MEIKSNQIHKLISKINNNRDIPRLRGPTQPRHALGRIIQFRTGMMHQISAMNCSCLLENKTSDYNIMLINFMSLISWISPKYKSLIIMKDPPQLYEALIYTWNTKGDDRTESPKLRFWLTPFLQIFEQNHKNLGFIVIWADLS